TLRSLLVLVLVLVLMSLLSVQFVNKLPRSGANTFTHSKPQAFRSVVVRARTAVSLHLSPPLATPVHTHSNAFVTAFVLVSVLVKSLNSSFSAYSPFSSHRPLVVDFNSLRLLSLARFVASLALSDCASRPGSLVTLSEHWIALPVHVARHGSVGRGRLLTPAAYPIFAVLPRRPNFRLECRVAL
ncbi:hypothetical protein GN958_ATG21705, partial [Phytophthora infestans]